MRKVLITRYGAYGDMIHASHLPRLLKQRVGFDYVAFEYNPKGFPVLQNNPWIDEHIHFDPHGPVIQNYPYSFYERRWKALIEEKGFEEHINLQKSLEYGYIAMEDQNEYFMSSEYRRYKFGGMNYYDQTSVWAGYPEFMGERGELHFTQEEEEIVGEIYDEHYRDKFVVIANLSGTSKHKLFYNAEHIIKTFLSRHEDAVCILMGDEDCRLYLAFEGERIVNRAGRFNLDDGGNGYPFRQAMLMTKYSDLVIGCESGLMVAATLLGAPTVQLMTAASIRNHGGDFGNDFSLQSPAACSPCHKGPYDFIGCPKFEYLGSQYPVCIKFDSETVLNQMERVYAASRTKAAY